MTNYFYTDANGQKQGPVDDNQLQALVTQRIITPESPLETDTGLKGQAGQIPGLNFNAPTSPFTARSPSTMASRPIAASSPFAQPAQVVPSGKSRVTAGVLGICLGGLGAHKFYMGSWGWGIVYILTCWLYVPAIVGLVEGIMYLTMSDDAFAAKYPSYTQGMFRW